MLLLACVLHDRVLPNRDLPSPASEKVPSLPDLIRRVPYDPLKLRAVLRKVSEALQVHRGDSGDIGV